MLLSATNTRDRLVSPNNPAGSIYPAPLLADILALCQKRGIWLILDETYRDFMPLDMDVPHHLFAKEDWQSSLIQLYSFSNPIVFPGIGLVPSLPAATSSPNWQKLLIIYRFVPLVWHSMP
jgi:bifunctional pyridoxal-dependent enzyme with beta-cystathionase and maltose regulon repressor activities